MIECHSALMWRQRDSSMRLQLTPPLIYRRFLIIILSITAIHSASVLDSADIESGYYHITKNVAESSVQNLSPYRTEGSQRRLDCARLCALEGPACASAVYNSNEGLCLLFSQYQNQLYSVTSNISSIFSYYHKGPDCDWIVQDEDCCSPSSASTECFDWNIIPLYKDCQDAFDNGERASGSRFYLKPTNDSAIIKAVCQFDSTSGWTVIQQRLDGSVDFYRYWDDYVTGFGDLDGEYWIGLESIQALTTTNRLLSIYFETHDGEIRTANYTTFYLDGEDTNYRLQISGYSGDAGDNLITPHNNMPFSTRDMDSMGRGCAVSFTGGWWYGTPCHHSNLNGQWYAGGTYTQFATGTSWYSWKGHYYSFKTIYMRLSR